MTTEKEKQKIEKLAEKIKKLEVQKKQLEAITKEKSRKSRTRRLIQIGAIMDSIGIDNIVTAERFKDYITNTPKSKEWLDKFITNYNSKQNEKTNI